MVLIEERWQALNPVKFKTMDKILKIAPTGYTEVKE